MYLAMSPNAWAEYKRLSEIDKKMLKKVNKLIDQLMRNPDKKLAKAEKLSYELSGFMSVRIDKKNRLVYKYIEGNLYIAQCGYHYSDK